MVRFLLPLAAFLCFSAAHAADFPAQSEHPTNAELKAMFEADQAERKAAEIDWAKLDASDETRRKRARALMDAGALQSGDDYYHAAYIFQHGSEASDYLLAHVLAVTAMKRGRASASWIASATLDRYLQSISQPQIFGTQYSCRDGRPSMELTELDLVPDSVRAVLSVPVRSKQEQHGQFICGSVAHSTTTK